MSRIVPSQVVSYMDSVLPEGAWPNIGPGSVGRLAGLLDLIDRIPNELIVLETNKFSDYILALSTIREQMREWANAAFGKNTREYMTNKQPQIMGAIKEALVCCPDEVPASTGADLLFITDADLRQNVRQDIAAVNRALANGEWKAVTVLAGSTVEALLLWALGDPSKTSTVNAGIAALVTSGALKKKPPSSPEEWVLHEYIEVAAKIGVIKPDTAIQSRLAKDFRNLIHPGRAQRLSQQCDRATALAAVAGMEMVIRDLT